MKWLAETKTRSEIALLCRDWMDHNRPPHVKVGSVMGAAVSALGVGLTIPFHPSMDAAWPHMVGYAAASLLCIINYLFISFLEQRQALTHGRARCLLIVPAATIVSWLSLVTALIGSYGLKTAFYAQILAVMLTAILMSRYWREQYILSLIALVQTAAVAIYRPEAAEDALMMASTVLLACLTAFVLRREFYAVLYERYTSLSAVLPRRVARYLTLSQSSGSLAYEFAARERYTACVCSDWRGFQQLARTLGANGVARLFEEYYDLVFQHLDRLEPEGRYYVDWTADELFVIFYADADGSDANVDVAVRALRFADTLATAVYEESRRCSASITYDIGVAAGYGVLGLIGPQRLKKTTNASFAAGTSKRLEGEAKALRIARSDRDGRPRLAVDEELWELARERGLMAGGDAVHGVATTKDVEGRSIVIWQSSPIPEASKRDEESLALPNAG